MICKTCSGWMQSSTRYYFDPDLAIKLAPKAGSNPVSLVCIGPAILLFPIPQRIPYTCCMTLLLTCIGDASAPSKQR